MSREFFILALLIPTFSLGAQNSDLGFSDGVSSVAAAVQQVDRTVIDVRIGRLDYQPTSEDGKNEYKVNLPDDFGISRGAYLGPGSAVLPTITRLIAIPFDSDPSFLVMTSDFEDINDVSLAPADEEDLQSLAYYENGMLQTSQRDLVTGIVAGIMRDLRLYEITISPVQYNPDRKTLRVYHNIQIEINHAGSQLTRNGDQLSEAFVPIYRSILDNALVFDPVRVTRGAYWIIYPDVFEPNIQPLVEWKKAKGFSVETISKTQIGSNNATAIRTYIVSRFDTCQIKPDYIVIVGDVTMPNSAGIATRSFNNSHGYGDSDNYYGFLQLDDYFPDILIGRVAFDTQNELTAYINKLFSYERTPYMDSTNWYQHATVVCGFDGTSFASPRATKLWCRERMMESGFTQVDTFFASYDHYVPPREISASINHGVSFVNYRGYGWADSWTPPDYTVDHINQLTNGPMYPIMTSIVCATGDYDDGTDVCFGEAWIRGANKGGAGFIGNTNHYAHTQWTNTIDIGIYWGWFTEGVATLAQGELMGKMNLYNTFPNNRAMGGEVELYFNTYNDLGDPELNVWTGIPMAMNVTCPDTVEFGQNRLDVHLEDAQGAPVEGAVCIWKEGEVFNVGFTGPDGNYEFIADPQTTGGMKLTATARGYIPYEDSIMYVSSPVTVSYLTHAIDDDANGESSGDGDGIGNPSEIIELPVMLKNFGLSDTAFGVSATLVSESPFIEIARDSASYADMAAGDSAMSDRPYLIRVLPDAMNGANARLLLNIADTSGHAWGGLIHFPIQATQLDIDAIAVFAGGDSLIDPGETVEIVTTLRNDGAKPIVGATAILRTIDSRIQIIDSAATFGDCQPGATFSNDADRFIVSVDPDVYVGHLINFTIEFTGQGPQVTSTSFSRTVGTVESDDPMGPDGYGYYCFDNTDTSYAFHPTYDSIFIDTQHWPYLSILDDDVDTLALPFPVKFYGQFYNEVTVCDNGYIAMGLTWWANFLNTPIPGPQNAPAMIAPFWDDIGRPPVRVYHYYDTTGASFIIAWRNVYSNDIMRNQTFLIKILDEASWPTITDDNEIVFQYQVAQNPDSVSVGICSPDRRDGICYLFDSNYAPGADTLANGRAIKFTTGSMTPTDVRDPLKPGSFALAQNYPNPFNAATEIRFSIPASQHVTLDIFNVLGQKVETILDGDLPGGQHRAIWNSGRVSSGIYFYRLTTPGNVVTKRMTLLK